jgi:uncharacterized protein with HEPN domain
MRPEKLYLTDIVDAADAISRFVADIRYDDFVRDELRQSAVLQKLIVIGEAASHLSPDFRANHTAVEWADIVGFRNIAVHEYFAVNWSIVWVAATEDVPFLKDRVAQILAAEYADE